MATLITQLNKTEGNYQTVFIYTVNASFNGIAGDITSAEIKIFFPDLLNIYLGDIKDPIKNIREEIAEDGRYIIFDLESIEDLGIALRIGIGMTFKLDAVNLASYTCIPELWINGIKVIDYVSESIQLIISTRFELLREIVLPQATPAPGSTIYYKVTLQNFGDLGGIVEQILIQCNGLETLTIDPNFNVIGKDTSSSQFKDTSQDGMIGTIIENKVLFEIPHYHGEKYEFIYRATINETVPIGTELNTTATWSIDTIHYPIDTHVLTLAAPLYDAQISLYGPRYSLPNEYVCYEFSIKNIGNQVLESTRFMEELPQEIDYYQLKTGTFHFGSINIEIDSNYSIDYTTIQGNSGTLGPFHTNVNSTIELSTIIDQGDNLSSLVWNIPSIGVGVTNQKPSHLNGIIQNNITIGFTILNHFELNWYTSNLQNSRVANHTIILGNMCVLKPTFQQSISGLPVKPGEIITYKMGANTRQSPLYSPLFAILLPKELTYMGNVSLSYSDYFNTSSSPIVPPVILVENFNDNDDTLVKFAFKDDFDFRFKQKSKITLSFDVLVKNGAQGSIACASLLNSFSSIGIIPSSNNVYRDTNNIANDASINTNYAVSSSIQNIILFFISITSNKKVKGLLDLEFHEEPTIGNTLEGGSIDYKITLENIGNATLDRIEIIDILPYVGDYGVIQVDSPRNSDFQIYTISEVVGEISPTMEAVTFDIWYSYSTDPLRFGSSFNLIGSDPHWMNNPPDDLVNVRAIKLVTNQTPLPPNHILTVFFKAIVPIDTPAFKIAWNTFAADVTYTDIEGNTQHLLAIEPEKVGVQVKEQAIDKGEIGGFVWFDSSKDGFYSLDESKMNDIGVVLYNKEGIPLKATFTTTTANNQNGFYLFNNLDLEEYFIKFYIDTNIHQFTTQRLHSEIGSFANETTGITPSINLSLNPSIRTINTGVILKEIISIERLLVINKSVRDTLKTVIYNQMLLTMKQEELINLLEKEL